MNTKAWPSWRQSAEGKANSSLASPNTGPRASHRGLHHLLPETKIPVPMISGKSGATAPRSPQNDSAKAKNGSPMLAPERSAWPGVRLPHSETLTEKNSKSDPDNQQQKDSQPADTRVSAQSPPVGGTQVPNRRASSAATALDEEVMERLQSLAEEGADSGTLRKTSPQPCGISWKAFAACVAVLVLVFGSLAALLARRWSFGPRRLERSSVCATPGCQQVAAAILSRLDHSVQPCDDIQTHVCGTIKWESELVIDTATEMVRLWQKRGAAYLESKKKPSAAFALYEACMHPRREALTELKAFMRDRRLSWPEYKPMGRHALYVLLDLLINWGVPFWFEMSLRLLPKETRYSLYITRVRMNRWRRQQQISDHQGRLMQYAMQFYDIYDASQEDRARIPQLLRLEKAIHAVIEPADNRKNDEVSEVFRVPFSIAALFTPNITAETWLQYLNEHLHPYQLQNRDSILIDDFSLTKMMTELFRRFSNEDMLYTLGWWFAQQFTFITSLDGGVVSYGSVAVAQANRPADCYALAESRFRRQLFYERARASLGAVGMLHAEDVLVRIRHTTITMLESLPWMDARARKEAAAIVAATRLESWKWNLAPVDVSQVSDYLSKKRAGHDDRQVKKALHISSVHPTRVRGLYSSQGAYNVMDALRVADELPEHASVGTHAEELRPSDSSVVQRWIKWAIIYKSKVPGWPLNDTLQHRHLSYAELVQYDYWWNSLFLQMAAFTEPLFFLDQPSLSANYAGLGFAVARHLVKAFDFQRGTKLDVNRRKGSWISNTSRSVYEAEIACAGRNEWILDHIAALEIALAAAFDPEIGHSTGAETKNSRYSVPGQSETYTSEMVFFLAYCRATCGSKPGCGDVLRNVDLFRKSFKCPDNSPMTAAPKCSFFGK